MGHINKIVAMPVRKGEYDESGKEHEIVKRPIIQELIALLNQNQQKEAANNVLEMVVLIDGMGRKLEMVTEELLSVRKQLEKMEQENANKTLKVTIRKTVDSLEQQCQKMKEQLFEIKIEVKAKASEIVSEVKIKGKTALHRVSEFFGIKEKLETVRDNVHKSIGETEQIIHKLDALEVADIMRHHELFKSIYASNLKSRVVNVMSCLITHMNTDDNTCFPAHHDSPLNQPL